MRPTLLVLPIPGLFISSYCICKFTGNSTKKKIFYRVQNQNYPRVLSVITLDGN